MIEDWKTKKEWRQKKENVKSQKDKKKKVKYWIKNTGKNKANEEKNE